MCELTKLVRAVPEATHERKRESCAGDELRGDGVVGARALQHATQHPHSRQIHHDKGLATSGVIGPKGMNGLKILGSTRLLVQTNSPTRHQASKSAAPPQMGLARKIPHLQ